MNFWNKLFSMKKDEDEALEKLLHELEQAKKEWEVARARLDQVVAKEEIDYAIYAHQAAQKRYELLLRQVRNLELINKHKADVVNHSSNVTDRDKTETDTKEDDEKTSDLQNHNQEESYKNIEEKVEKNGLKEELNPTVNTSDIQKFKITSYKQNVMIHMNGKGNLEGER